MTNQQARHCQFQLCVAEYGVEAWTQEPESFSSLLLLIAEGLANGFWADGSETA